MNSSYYDNELELNNFKDAVKLIWSDEKPAIHNEETLEAQRKIHPKITADQKHPKQPHMNSLQVTHAIESQVIKSFPLAHLMNPTY